MVDALAQIGGLSPAVLDAVRRVPRASFVPRGTSPEETYDVQRAVALSYGGGDGGGAASGGATSTVSAPIIVAAMLELLALRPGLRVLEIGTGSGYNAALLAELVGDASLVTSVDIDEELVVAARSRLAALGWGGVTVVAGDGWEGVAARAPYDRIVATVGVSDVAPAWAAQLAASSPSPAGAFMLLPLHHGGVHPILRVAVDASSRSVEGRPVARSGFVSIRGHQASRAPWRHAGSARANEPVPAGHVERLPAPLATDTAHSRTTPWDFSYWLAMADHRTANLCTLVDDDGSVAVVDVRAGLVSWSGASGETLRDTLVARAEEWLAMGTPRAEAWHSTFVPIDDDASLPSEEPGRRYVIRRVDHAQVVTLLP